MTPTPRLVKINAWSYSCFTTYQLCPYKAKLTTIDKLKEPQSKAMDNGNRVHALADVFTTGRLPEDTRDLGPFLPELKAVVAGGRIPAELECFEEEFKAMKKAKAATEQQWAFDANWNYLPPPNGWFSAAAWLRIKVDAVWLETVKKGKLRETTVQIRDHKTGKFNPEHAEQRSLYALGAFLIYPDAVRVTAAHWYLDVGREESQTWETGQVESLKKEWTRKTKAMLNDTTFAPRPNDKCKWCHFRAANGGPCKF